jgi:cation diffusion facilitator CzcD-associated flavoprotein CzcO
MEHFDVLIVGAGLSGIDAAYHLQKYCPQKSYVILEQRERIGGTWDLFRYPGIRSDSDMLTMSYSFRPWTKATSISPGVAIREYITATAQESGIDGHIRFGHEIRRAAWSSEEARWEVQAAYAGQVVTLTCNFLFSCAGYYRYSAGYLPEFPQIELFQGRVVHPQAWPEDLDYRGKRVVVIGSGATAVTLVPAIAKTAAHVTMLQRSPTYVVALPEQDKIANWLRGALPEIWAYRLGRWKNVGFQMYIYQLSQRFPDFVKKKLIQQVCAQVGPGCDVATHFTPRYNPWQQRMCVVPDADLFRAIRAGRASVSTGQIEAFTGTGIKLASGEELPADIVVTATGLVLQAFGGMELSVDGERVDLSNRLSYRGLMVSGVPNFAAVFGYINASWTLKADLICTYVCRLLNYMDRKGLRQVTPQSEGEMAAKHFVENFTSGYVQRSLESWPKQGAKAPWRVYQNYVRDFISLKWASLRDGALVFGK